MKTSVMDLQQFTKKDQFGYIYKGKMVFAKLIFFPPNFFCSERFPFSKIPKKKVGGKKN